MNRAVDSFFVLLRHGCACLILSEGNERATCTLCVIDFLEVHAKIWSRMASVVKRDVKYGNCHRCSSRATILWHELRYMVVSAFRGGSWNVTVV